MAAAQLSFRLAGITAMCLAAMVAPVSTVDRILILAALGLGIGFASVMPGYDRSSPRLIGPAVLILALLPPTGMWVIVNLVALCVVGFAGFNNTGMRRAVPALGLGIAAVAYRAGEMVSIPAAAAWLLAVIATLVLGNLACPIETGPLLGRGERSARPPLVLGRRRAFQMLATIVVLVPISLASAGAVGEMTSALFVARPQLGREGGPSLRAHPGLRGGLDAGAPVSLSDEVVLRVRADRPLYWRGTTYEDWDGRNWTTALERWSVDWEGDGVRLGPAEEDRDTAPLDGVELPEPETLVQTFKAEQAGLDVLLGAWEIDALWSTARNAELGEDGTVALNQPLRAGAAWTVHSTVVPAEAQHLRAADPAELSPSSEILLRYATEDDVSADVAELAASITAGLTNSYDKIIALEAWMDNNITYTRNIARLADGEDAVTHLLFESRRGFCEQIGSALVVMLRSLGIPARLVVGYVPGEYDGKTGEWLSRGTDAHAWAEVYFPGIGWQGFDPTAGVAVDPSDAEPSGRSLGPASWMAVAAATVVIVAVIVGVNDLGGRLRRRSRGYTSVLFGLQRRFDGCETVVAGGWSPSTTLREKEADLVAAGLPVEIVAAVTRRLERLRYGPDDPIRESSDLGPESPLRSREADLVALAEELTLLEIEVREVQEHRNKAGSVSR